MPNHVGVAIFVESTDGSAPVQFFRSLDVSLCSLDNCSSGCPKSGFRGSGCRISAGFRISAHSPIEKPRSILLRFQAAAVSRNAGCVAQGAGGRESSPLVGMLYRLLVLWCGGRKAKGELSL